jgi:hypothetical protein
MRQEIKCVDREEVYNVWLCCLESEFNYLAHEQNCDLGDVFEMLESAVEFLKENYEDLL